MLDYQASLFLADLASITSVLVIFVLSVLLFHFLLFKVFKVKEKYWKLIDYIWLLLALVSVMGLG